MPPKTPLAKKRAARSPAGKTTVRKTAVPAPAVEPATQDDETINTPSASTPIKPSASPAEEDESNPASASTAITAVSDTGSPLPVNVFSRRKSSTSALSAGAEFSFPHQEQVAAASTDETVEPAIAKDKPCVDVVSERQTVSTVEEDDASGKPSAEAVQMDGAVSVLSDSNPKIDNRENEAVISPHPDDNGSAEAPVSKDAVSSGGKGKRIVKKTVKVVKKVIKKVPKRLVKAENDAKVESEDVKPIATELGQNGGSVESEPMEIVEEKKSVETQTVNENIPLEVSMKGSADSKETTSMEVDQHEDAELKNENVGAGAGEGEVAVKNEAEGGDTDAHGQDGVEEEGDNNAVERENEAEVDDNAGTCVDVTGERLYTSGKMEAIERRRRRRTQIFVGGLDKDVKEEDIKKVFEEVGEILELKLMKDSNTGRSKGYAFLRYASAESARTALKKFATTKICGKQCTAKPADGNDTLYLGNIDKKWKEDDVHKLLKDAGIEKIDKVNILMDPRNIECNRGFVFVEMETSKDAKIAFSKLTKKDAFGKNSNIKVAWAEQLEEIDEEEMLKVKTVYAEFIPSDWDEDKVKESFKKFGEITSVALSRNIQTFKRKDFAFINYTTREAAITCIGSFNREFTSDDGTKVNIKVSLAKPSGKGKQPKQLAKPVVRQTLKATSKATPTPSSIRPVHPIAQGRLLMPQYDGHRTDEPSANAELVRLLREQASWHQPQPSMSHGHVDINYANNLSGRKRPLTVLEPEPLYSDLRYTHPRIQPTYLVSGPSYSSLPPMTAATTSTYYQHPGGYTVALPYGSRNYPGNEANDRGDGRSLLYRRY